MKRPGHWSDPDRPLWTCPKCGHQFVIANIWHSCGHFELDEHFAGKDAHLREVFDAWRALAEACGPVTVYAQKTRIVFQVRVRFGGATIHRHAVMAGLWLKRPADHPSLARREELPPDNVGHYFKLTRLEDVDDNLAALVREAYRIGCQDHLRKPG